MGRIAVMLLVSLVYISTNAIAQKGSFGIGVGVTYLESTIKNEYTSVKASRFPTRGIIINPFYNLNAKMRIDIHVKYFFGKKETSTFNDHLVGPITFDSKTNLLAFGPNFQYAFVGKFRGDGVVVYGLAGFTEFSASFTQTETVRGIRVPNYFPPRADESYLDFNIGAGIEYPFNPHFSIFAEPSYAIGLNGNTVIAGISTKLSGFAADAGIRYTFGSK